MTPFEQELFTRWIKGVHLPASLTTLNHTVLTQYTLSKGLQVFGPLGKEAMFHEMQQLHQWKVCEPRKATSTIDATEGRDVVTVDIPGAFMNSDQDETVHLQLQGTLADLLVKCDPKLYHKYVVTEGGQQVLYVELIKVLASSLQISGQGFQYQPL